jgi:hypothetical protein
MFDYPDFGYYPMNQKGACTSEEIGSAVQSSEELAARGEHQFRHPKSHRVFVRFSPAMNQLTGSVKSQQLRGSSFVFRLIFQMTLAS